MLGVRQWISLGAIPAAVAHTRPVPILGTASRPGLLRGGVSAGPTGLLKVPAAALSMLEMAVSEAGIPAVGYFAQIPHYVSGSYALAALELVKAVEQHLDVSLPRGDLVEESRQLRLRLDAATAADESTRAYVERLESMVDESRQPAGDDLIADIERFLRDRSGEGVLGRVLSSARGGRRPSGPGSWPRAACGSRGPRLPPAPRPARTRPRSGSRRCRRRAARPRS